MASRKTYFGIGLPPDPFDPESGPLPLAGPDKEDRSSPTVVDDEKVAEGLRQLRSWYQSDAQPESPPELVPALVPAPAPALAPAFTDDRTPKAAVAPPIASNARPTAVGHATAPPAAAAVHQRPFAPDPMRATMYGHDVHRFDLETPADGNAPPPPIPTPMPAPAPATSTALVLASPRPEEALRVRTPVPESSGLSPSGSFQLAHQGEAARLQRPPGMRRSGHDLPRSKNSIPLSSRIFFGAGMLALAAAVLIWWQTENTEPPPAARPTNQWSQTAAPVAPIPPPSAGGELPATTAVPQPTTVTASPASPASPIVNATLRARTAQAAMPSPAKPMAAPRADRVVPLPAVNRRRAPTVEVAKPDDDGESPTETPPATAPAPTTPVEKNEAAPAAEQAHKKEPAAAPDTPARKKTEPAAVQESPVRKKTEPTTAPEAAPRKKSRIGSDADATLPPSED